MKPFLSGQVRQRVLNRNGSIVVTAIPYELSNTQWEQRKDLDPQAKTGQPSKDSWLMLNTIFDSPETVHIAEPYSSYRLFTAALAISEITEQSCRFFML